MARKLSHWALAALAFAAVQTGSFADTGLVDVTDFSLTSLAQAPPPSSANESWDVEGFYNMRAADTQEFGVLDIKNFFGYSTSSNGTDDDYRYNLWLQYGVWDRHELVLKLPVEIGDGGVSGNADISIGHQWRLLDEQGWMPAFAIYHEIRLPSGYHSSGHDYELRGVFTKSIIPEELRLHVNPFVKWLDPDNLLDNISRYALTQTGRNRRDLNELSGRHFAAGTTVGMDWRMTDTATVNANYILDTGRLDGYRIQHAMEAGIDYEIAAGQTLSWSTRWTLDGDSQGDNFGFVLGYIIAFDVLGVPN